MRRRITTTRNRKAIKSRKLFFVLALACVLTFTCALSQSRLEPRVRADGLELLWSVDFSQKPEELVDKTTVESERISRIDDNNIKAMRVIKYYEMLAAGWTVAGETGDGFMISGIGANYTFYQTVPGEMSYWDIANGSFVEPLPFHLKVQSTLHLLKSVAGNEQLVKIYIDPVVHYGNRRIDLWDANEIGLFERTEEYGLRINGEIVSDNVTGVIEYSLADSNFLSIQRLYKNDLYNDIDYAKVIYKIEMYGTNASPDTSDSSSSSASTSASSSASTSVSTSESAGISTSDSAADAKPVGNFWEDNSAWMIPLIIGSVASLLFILFVFVLKKPAPRRRR